MSATTQTMVNEDYEPGDSEEQILDVLKDGRERGEPWGRATPGQLREETGIEKGNIEFHLRNLTTAGWIRKLSRGLYELEDDPREVDERQRLEAAARERWGEEWAIEQRHWADGTSDAHAYHIEPTEDADVCLRDRLFVGADGEVYHDRLRLRREDVLEVVERDEPPEEIASELVYE